MMFVIVMKLFKDFILVVYLLLLFFVTVVVIIGSIIIYAIMWEVRKKKCWNTSVEFAFQTLENYFSHVR